VKLSENEIMVTSCLSSCEDCTGIYKDVTNFIRLSCHCPCHSTKKRSLVMRLVGQSSWEKQESVGESIKEGGPS
jgi:hypothetical protein